MSNSYDSLYLYLGMATGAISTHGALEDITEALRNGTVNRSYIEYLRDKLSQALKDSE